MAASAAKDGTARPLKLRAEDEEDIGVVSAILQDAMVAVGEMAYVAEDRRFIMLASRLRRESRTAGLERTRCFVWFDEVKTVWRQRFSRRDGERILVLLAIRYDGGNVLRIDFSGGAAIRLEVGRILCHLHDIGAAWPTRQAPRHPVEGGV